MSPETIKALIEAGIPGAQVQVDGDGAHFQAVVVSEVFRDLPLLKKHQLVYGTLGNRMQGEIHALSIKTYTPEEWESARDLRVLG